VRGLRVAFPLGVTTKRKSDESKDTAASQHT
jgi:hypothetical protein